ncbi:MULTISPECIES: transposase [unclassified Pseudomonas]|uniref:transposase n=1 Tax=unclassified Pseudomonas TaxID=196821 RepID=UPI001FD0839A|nr:MULTISPECIES: transposase [unclassified Pseudomonas]
MMAGSRIIAPEGFQCLAKGTTYHFLRSDGATNRVRMIEFFEGFRELKSQLLTVSRVEFEYALEAGLVLEDGTGNTSPPWLQPVERLTIAHRESLRVSTKESYDQKVNRRFAAISDLVVRLQEILASDNPDAIINAHAKAQRPQQNASRLRLWFYTYIMFGHNKWALMPPLHRIGSWDRNNPSYVRRLGRPSPNGKEWGYRSDGEMREKINKGYLAFRSPYKTAGVIYAETLTKVFGCVAVKKGERFEFIHPKGAPFPTYAQARYQVKRAYSSKERSEAVRGKQKTRAISGSSGSFADRLLNVNQLVEFDGYYITEKLSGVSENSAVDSFCVVRAVCGLSGLIVGIGFADGKEKMDAYKMCLLSMASNKVKYCELFGVPIEPSEWPSQGLAPGVVFDRGPGATFDVESAITWLGTFENTPVFSGQSKATVESSHRRVKKTLDQPTFLHSKLNFVEMAKWEILQVLKDNLLSDASRRLDDELVLARVKPTPLAIFNYWDSRGRNSAHGMQFEAAIKEFLVERPAAIRSDAVYFFGRKYSSPSLIATGVFDRVAKNGVISTMVHILTMCVRHIWIEVYGELHELDFVQSQRTLEGLIDISLSDLQMIYQIRREGVAALRDETPAGIEHFRARCKLITGLDPFAGRRQTGRPPKNASYKQDQDDFNRIIGKVG